VDAFDLEIYHEPKEVPKKEIPKEEPTVQKGRPKKKR